MASINLNLDIAVIGGGIAGLWLARRLAESGYSCALFEKAALGSDQTLASQGMIHGGVKYTLAGSLSGASESIADMPAYWQACLAGTGDMDLSAAKILSDHFYFWSSDKAGSKVTTFFASKALRGRVNKLARAEFPTLLQNPAFHGQVYQLQDIVVDVPSVLEALAAPIREQLFLLPSEHRWQRNSDNKAQLLVTLGGDNYIINAKQFILAAGKGNGDVLAQLAESKPAMQLRPLHQVWVKHQFPHGFYGHCLGADSTPRLSISTHPARDGRMVWSLGGSIAEKGVAMESAELIAATQKELRELLPWLDFSAAEFITARIDRAEARQRNFLRPDKAFVASASSLSNVLVAWPTKLTLAPNLANETLQALQKLQIAPAPIASLDALAAFSKPELALPPWDQSSR